MSLLAIAFKLIIFDGFVKYLNISCYRNKVLHNNKERLNQTDVSLTVEFNVLFRLPKSQVTSL